MMKLELIGYCGVDCSSCPDFKTGVCPGCRRSSWKEGEGCMPVACCTKRKIRCCGECDIFPCESMAQFYRESDGHRAAYKLMRSISTTKFE